MSTETKGRSKRSYLQLKVNISDTTPTGALILDALYSNDPEFFKRFGLGPKVTKANKLLWLAYLGLTQSNVSNGYVIENTEIEAKPEPKSKSQKTTPPPSSATKAVPKPVEASQSVELPQLPLESTAPNLPKLEMTKVDNIVDEDDLDENALMAGLI
jgi:hypothetical protein